ncbi:MAG: NTP transferase domain-containing protein, partial [Sphingobacteriales bacterium]
MNLPEETRAMIFAAGLGTRLKPFTDKHPKALAPVNGKPLLQRNIEYLKQFGIKDIIVNVHHFADQIID